MARKPYVLTPARSAHLTRLHELNRKRGAKSRLAKRRKYGSNAVKRGTGVKGIKKNSIPYARINKNSQTVGLNSGTIIPGTGKRIAFGGYLRLENTNRKKNPIDRATRSIANALAPKGTRAGKVREYFNKNVTVTAPLLRANVGGSQVRLGTSRRGGPTFIIRKGNHKTPKLKSQQGIRKYDKRIATISKQKKTRRARRGK